MDNTPDNVVFVTCRTGSLEKLVDSITDDMTVTCRTGSLEIPL